MRKILVCLLVELTLFSALFVVISNRITHNVTDKVNKNAYQLVQSQNHREWVQAVCDWSHTHDSGDLEQRCGEAQDATNTEYLCVTGTPDLNCWVEQK